MIKLLFILIAFAVKLSMLDAQGAEISRRLLSEIINNPNQSTRISLVLKDKYDIGALNEAFNLGRVPLNQRVNILKPALIDHAQKSQQGLLIWLDQQNGQVEKNIKSYWISNLIYCTVKNNFIAELAKRNEIQFMDINAQLKNSSANEENQLKLNLNFMPPNGAEKGLKVINAHKLWALGYSGYGLTAYVADTGIDPNHPAFRNKAKSYFAPAEETWFDFNGQNVAPTNCGDHGTHCLGTILGLDRNTSDTIGVAFNANWIGAAILCGLGSEDNLAALQWAIDPDGDPTTIADMPTVINNSWYDPDIFDDCNSLYVQVEEALEAAGIASIFSAGNAGPDPQSITSPHNININIVNSFTIAALNGNTPILPIANFSSRGPSKCGGQGSLLIKPEVAAPGVDVRSAVFGNAYDLKSGTSMAAPHTCGAILLLKEAFPNLSGYDLKLALYNTATDLGEPGEDNIFGNGLINVWAAYNYLINQGNFPQIPTRNNDLLIYGLEGEGFECESKMSIYAKIENAGTDTIKSALLKYTLEYSGNKQEFTVMYDKVLAPGQRDVAYYTPSTTLPGMIKLTIDVETVNGELDEKPLNNRIIRNISIFDFPFQNFNLDPTDAKTCTGTQIQLSTDYDLGKIEWYNDASFKMLVATGNPILLPPASKEQTIWMVANRNGQLGKDINSVIDEENINKPFGGIAFSCQYPFLLKSVKVKNTSKGLRKIALLNNGAKVFEKNFVMQTTGIQELVLNFPIPISDNLVLELDDAFKPLVKANSGSNFPYTVNNVVSLNYNTAWLQSGYNYFFDWVIEYRDFCEAPSKVIPFFSDTLAPDALFEGPDTIFIVGSQAALYEPINLSLNATDFDWSTPFETKQSVFSPIFEFNTDGKYKISLFAKNNENCYDTQIQDVTVLTLTSTNDRNKETGINLWPNPTSNFLNVESDLLLDPNAHIRVLTALGIPIRDYQSNGSSKLELNLNAIPAGMYFMKLQNKRESRVTSFVVK